MTEATQTSTTRSNRTLWILVAVFVIPVIGSYAYFFFGKNFAHSNHGDLLDPILQLQQLGITTNDGKLLDKQDLQRKWRMIFIVGSDCDAACKKRLYEMRQMNIALGKNEDRVKHMILHTAPADPAFQQYLDKEQTAAENYTIKSEKLPAPMKPGTHPNAIYYMDPLGNIILRFGQDIKPKLILQDMNKLLKISRIG